MYDYFTEHLVQRKKNIGDVAIVTLSVFAGVLVSAFTILSGLLFIGFIGQIALIAVFFMWWGIYFLISSRNIEFEYTVTNGETDIDKILGKRKRKRVISFTAKEIEMIDKDSDYRGNFDEVIDTSSNNPSHEKYAIVILRGGKRTKVLVNPSEKMLKIYKRFRPQNVNWSEE